ncbi:MAG: hypothetical protein PF505_08000 [Vallitaleaceae bacterium]|jgi:hypothetical protein|nr:hypothetical protein [Vallitaleaceae bacterium]
MDSGVSWADINNQVDRLVEQLDKKAARRYRIDLIKRMAIRMEEFELANCEICVSNQLILVGLIGSIQQLKETGGKYDSVQRKAIVTMTEHLKNEHKLVEKDFYTSQYMAIGIALGAGIGVALGAGVDNLAAFIGVGTALGAGVGVAVGAGADAKAVKEGRTI